jgi:hypothetical protein
VTVCWPCCASKNIRTFIGKIERGFDYLGYQFGPGILKLADTTIERFVAHATRVYERGRQERVKARSNRRLALQVNQ